MTAQGKRKPADGARRRSAARMAAVQALYQMDLAGTDVSEVIEQFETRRFEGRTSPASGDEADADTAAGLVDADPVFFAELLRGVVRRQREIDPMVDHQLAQGWRLKRIDSTLRAVLRAGVFELMDRPDVPYRVVITEYINIAHAFFDEDEPKVVNGILDALARRVRTGELDGPSKSSGAK